MMQTAKKYDIHQRRSIRIRAIFRKTVTHAICYNIDKQLIIKMARSLFRLPKHPFDDGNAK
jgi:hypothetical protein